MERSMVKLINKHATEDVHSDAMLNLALLDPPRYGWSAIGGVIDVCPPHEKARRSSTVKKYLALPHCNNSNNSTNNKAIKHSPNRSYAKNSSIPRKRRASVSIESSSSVKTTNLVDMQMEPRQMVRPSSSYHHSTPVSTTTYIPNPTLTTHRDEKLYTVNLGSMLGLGLAATENFEVDLDHDTTPDVKVKQEEQTEEGHYDEKRKRIGDKYKEEQEMDKNKTEEKLTNDEQMEDKCEEDEKQIEDEQVDKDQIEEQHAVETREDDVQADGKQIDYKQENWKQTDEKFIDEKQKDEKQMNVEQANEQDAEDTQNKDTQTEEKHKEDATLMDEKQAEDKQIKEHKKGPKETMMSITQDVENSDNHGKKYLAIPPFNSFGVGEHSNEQRHTDKVISTRIKGVGIGIDSEDYDGIRTPISATRTNVVVAGAAKDTVDVVMESNTHDTMVEEKFGGVVNKGGTTNDIQITIVANTNDVNAKGLEHTTIDDNKEMDRTGKSDSIEPNAADAANAANAVAIIVNTPADIKGAAIRDISEILTSTSTTPTKNTTCTKSVGGCIKPSNKYDATDEDANNADDSDDDNSEDEEEYIVTEKIPKTSDAKTLRVNALKKNGKLNIHAYHRGIAGNEPRDSQTGELLCNTNPSDTNHKWDQPDLKLKVTVEFPLDDPVVTDEEESEHNSALNSRNNYNYSNNIDSDSDYDDFGNDNTNNKKSAPKRSSRRRNDRHGTKNNTDISSSSKTPDNKPITALEHRRQREHKLSLLPKFRDDIEWDLSDPSTPTPMIYAADIAAEFGLSLNQTLDLAAGIQRQIDEFCRERLLRGPYCVPITSKDPLMAKREDTSLGCNPPGFVLPKTLHGGHCASSIVPLTKSSIPQNDMGVTVTRAKGIKNSATVSSVGASNESSSAPRAKKSGVVRTRGPYTVVPKNLLPKHVVSDGKQEFVDELLLRSKREFIAKIKDEGRDGSFSIETNWVCHICHGRKAFGCIFACGNERHAYCAMHCSTRLGFTVAQVQEGFTLGYCPICCLQCVCAKCARQVNAVANAFEKKCRQQGLGPKDTVMEVLPLCTGPIPKMEFKPRIRESYVSPSDVMKSKKKHCPVVGNDLDRKDEHIVKRSRRTRVSKPSNDLTRPMHDTSQEKEREFDMGATPSPTSPFTFAHTSASAPTPALTLMNIATPISTPVSIPTSNSDSKRSKRVSSIDNQPDLMSSSNLRPKPKTYSNEAVIKVPSCEFPSEIFNDINIDPSLKDDYLTVFTPSGSNVTIQNPSIIAMADDTKVTNIVTTEQEEDGNVDYCLICNESGGIICCDKCPRGFHDACLGIQGKELPESWECPRCKTDETEQESDAMTGNDGSFQKIATALKKLQDTCGFRKKVMLLSKIHEMLNYLMNYDFGQMFSEPVNCNFTPGYKAVVKRPMDLGTICANLLKCLYFTRLRSSKRKPKGSFMDMIILEVLKDIERVWHNCFSYNYEGSAVYRMAEVQRKRCNAIRRCSIDAELEPFILEELEKFVRICEMKRRKITAAEGISLPKSNHTLDTGFPPSKMKRKIVGVFDPDTNMLVKQYSSISSAAKMATHMSTNLNHNSGMRNMTDASVKETIRNSSRDPSRLIFGYRWLFVQDLRDGNFSVDLPASLNCANIIPHKAYGANPLVYEKTCLTTGVTLATFNTISEAYADWTLSLKSSIDIVPEPSMETFQRHYLDDRNSVDNTSWKKAGPIIVSSYESHQQGTALDHETGAYEGDGHSQTAQLLEQNSTIWQHKKTFARDPAKPMDTELGEDSSFMQGSTKLNFASQGLETSKSLYNERVISSIPTKNCLEISACTNSQAINTESETVTI